MNHAKMEIDGGAAPGRARAGRIAPYVFAACLAAGLSAGCGGKKQEKEWLEEIPGRIQPADKSFHTTLAAARTNLAEFYLRTFPALLKGNFYKKEQTVTLADHLAHRLWIPEHDPSLSMALDGLSKLAIQEKVAGPEGMEIGIARFSDKDQLHRDQYATNMSEMGIAALGAAKLEEFVAGAKLDFGAAAMSQRGDTPWSVTLLAMNTAPGAEWRNSKGEVYNIDRVIDSMVNAPVPPALKNATGCYDYHILYSLGAAVRAGAAKWGGEANERMHKLIELTQAYNADSRARGDNSGEIVMRVKFNGHLIEAYFRGGPEVFPPIDFARAITECAEVLADDALRLRRMKVYDGPPDVMVSVPHAIHGLDLGLKANP